MLDNELLILLKYGTKENAIVAWQDSSPPGEFWELNIVQRWANPKVPLLKVNAGKD